MMWAIT